MDDINKNYYDNLTGCGTPIKWTFTNAKYQKGAKVFDKENNISGEITSSYHYGSEETRAYFIKWDNGVEKDYSYKEIEQYII
ncbi:MAG: hypothetical protein Q4F12_00265 [Erysipelotrichaceae bacterium]|nr:hypothetical protein [Erysipelotrichaceae bacterium]